MTDQEFNQKMLDNGRLRRRLLLAILLFFVLVMLLWYIFQGTELPDWVDTSEISGRLISIGFFALLFAVSFAITGLMIPKRTINS